MVGPREWNHMGIVRLDRLRTEWMMSHPEIFEFQDVIKIKNKNNNFLIVLKIFNIYFLYREFSVKKTTDCLLN